MAKTFMKIIGVVLVIVGIVGFFVPLAGTFDWTLTQNIVHLGTGVLALLFSGSAKGSAVLARIFGFVYLIVFVVGCFTHSFLGLNLAVADTIAYLVLAALFLYFGYKSSASGSTSA